MINYKNRLFYSYSSYLKKLYGTSAYRVSVDAGFSCPNRGDNRKNPGCTYCDEHGAKASYIRKERDLTIEEQVRDGIIFLKKRYKAEVFLLYFQAFSGTFAPEEKLREIYDYTLGLSDFSELIVSTRPDCINPRNADLLASYKERGLDVWVELGLQSASDISLKRINRGHTVEQFHDSFILLRERGIKITVHMIFGIPGETAASISESVDYLAGLHPEGLKIHNLHIPYATPMFNEYLLGELSVPCGERHIDYTIHALEKLPPDVIIHRLTCDTPGGGRAVPKNFPKKGSFYNTLRNEMLKRKTCQGRLYPGKKIEII